MKREFLAAVMDTILPSGEMGLPSGTAAGVDIGRHREAAAPVLGIIIAAAGGEESFLAASGEARRLAVEAAERQAPEAFRVLLTLLLPEYYESDTVLRAFGWRTEPPQPLGHALLPADEATQAALARVRRRGRIWRQPG